MEIIQADIIQWLKENQWLVENGYLPRFHAILGDTPYFLGSITKRFGKRDSAPARYGKDGIFQRSSRGFMGKCYHPDTEVLTVDGWKNIRDMVDAKYAGDVYTLNMRTGEIELSPVVDHQQYEFDGELIHFDSRSIDLLVTPNHNLVVRQLGSIGYRRADDKRNKLEMLSQGVWDTPRSTSTISVGNVAYPIEPLMRFLGIYIGDGCVVHRKNQPKKQDFISISTCLERKRKNIRQVCEQLGLKFAEYDRQTVVYNKAFNEWLSPLGHAHEKYIPEWVFSHDAHALNELWYGLLSTDGHSGKNGTIIQYSTSSKRLSDDIQRLLLLCGLSGTCHYRQPRGFRSKRGSYVISVHKRNKTLWFERIDHKTGKINAKPYPYRGMVYDVTVADNHTLYVRRNGRAVWSSNSWDGFEDVWQYQAWVTEWARLMLSYVYPNALCMFFGGSRTYHRVASGLEDAGWVVTDAMQYLYGSGFPKAHDVDGYKTALKPAYESIVVARAPRTDTYEAHFRQDGVGLLDIDAGRIEYRGDVDSRTFGGSWKTDKAAQNVYGGGYAGESQTVSDKGRYPANVILDEEAGRQLDAQSGERKAGGNLNGNEPSRRNRIYNEDKTRHEWESYADSGGASRFFYTAKAAAWEREAGLEAFDQTTVNDGRETPIDNAYQRGKTVRRNPHPTVKPITLIEYLAKLILPPEAHRPRRILIPFAGVGSEMIGAHFAGWDEVVGIEREDEYIPVAEARLKWWGGFKTYAEAERAAKVKVKSSADSPDSQDKPTQLKMFDL
jgi:site-specific DNA-methyltransferase (adenine-specific)